MGLDTRGWKILLFKTKSRVLSLNLPKIPWIFWYTLDDNDYGRLSVITTLKVYLLNPRQLLNL